MVPFLTAEGILVSNRAVWACLVHPTWGRLGLIGLYGPNDSVSRSELWNELAASLDTSCNWILMGDINMIENCCDQLGGEGNPTRGREAQAWANLMRRCDLGDTFKH